MGFTFPGNPFGSPNLIVPLVMFAWIPIVLYLFSRFPARQAVVISFLVAWLFLPQAELPLPGLPNYSKITATGYGILIATFIFDAGRFQRFRFGWLDIPMAIWCICPFISSMANGLGAYDGISAIITRLAIWGVPYFLGRIYLDSLAGMRQLAVGIFIGGLVYMPLCLYEVRMSPQLHRLVYGGFPHDDFSQTMRLGGFRPMVFMQHGLAVGAFMMAACLIGLWLWQTGNVKRIWNIPIGWLMSALFLTFVLARSTGALTLFMIGLGILAVAKYCRTALPVFILVGAIAVYLYINAETENYFSDQLIGFLSNYFPPDRIASLEFRFNNEELLVDRARDKLLFGWGGWGRSRVLDPMTNQITVQDSLWVIAFGENGTLGLVSLYTAMLLPVVVLFWNCYPARWWSHTKIAPVAAIGVMIVLYMLDCVMNAMINPIYILACGGVAGLAMNPEKASQPAARPRLVKQQQYVMQQRQT